MRKLNRASKFGIFSLTAAAAATALPSAGVFAQTNIVQNGGFESTDPTLGTGYAQYWNDQGPNASQVNYNAHSGSFAEYLNNTQSPGNVDIYQFTPAGSVTPGATYNLSFWAEGTFVASGEAQAQILWRDSGGNLISGDAIHSYFPGNSYSNFNYSYTAPANASIAQVQFYAVTGAVTGAMAQEYLDDVSFSTGSGSGGGGNNSSGATAWNTSGSGDWNISTNWTAGIPNGVGAEADMFSALQGSHTVYTDTPITLGTLNFNNTNTYVISGAGSLTMQASTGSATIIVQAGTQKIDLPLKIASNTNLNVSSGSTLLIANPVEVLSGNTLASTGSGTVAYQSIVTVDPGASLALASSTFARSLALVGSGNASVSSTGTRKLLQLDSLSVGTGSLDMGNNDLIVHGGSISAINPLLASGYANGAWTGSGIKSSAAAANSTHLTALGSMTVTSSGTFDGAAVSAGDVVVRYTYYGDATLDGTVNSADYAKVDNGFLGKLTGWQNGDFNYDGVINGSDYTLIDNAFNMQGAPIGAASAQFASASAQIAGGSSAVPEPGAISLLSLAALGLLRRRRQV